MGMGDSELDARIAGAIRANLPAIADAVIASHDRDYPASSLRSVPYEERVQWVCQNTSYIALSIEGGEPITWSYSYCPDVMGGFDSDTPPYVEIANTYETILSMEDCMLPYVFGAFADAPADLLAGVRRFRMHMLRFIDLNVEKLQADLARRLRRSLDAEYRRGRGEVLQRVEGYLGDAEDSLRQKIALAYDAVSCGHADEALALLTSTSLLAGDLMSKALAQGASSGASGAFARQSARASGAFGDALPKADGRADLPGGSAPADDGSHAQAAPASRLGAGGVLPPDGDAPAAACGSTVSRREAEVLRCVAAGKTNAEIAVELSLSVGTVRNYISALLDKLAAENRTQLAIAAVRMGVV